MSRATGSPASPAAAALGTRPVPVDAARAPRLGILHLAASPFVGGPQRQILLQAQRMDPARFDVTVATFLRRDEGEALLAEAEAWGVPAVGLAAGGPLDLSPLGALCDLLREREIGVVCAHDSKSTFFGYLAARRLGIPIVAWARGWTGETLRVRLYDSVHRWLLRRVDAVVAVSEAMRDSLLRRGIGATRIAVIPNAFVGPMEIAPDGRLRASLGTGVDTPLLVSVGRLSREKGHRYLVAAAARLAQRGHRFVLVIVGDGRERPRLERQIRRLALSDKAHLLGFRTDVPAIMAEADLVVLPSLTEGLPNVVLEAFAAGKPVVATRVGGVPEVVRHGEAGLLVAARDPIALAGGIEACLDDPARGEKMGQQGRRVLREYSPEAQVRRVGDLLEQVAAARQARTGARRHALLPQEPAETK